MQDLTPSIVQQTMQGYEAGRRRIPVSALTTLARALGVSLEALMGEPVTRTAKRGPAPKLAQHMERISQLPRTQQQFVMRMLDTMLAQQGR